MWIKIELTAVSSGILAVAILWADLWYGANLWPETHHLISYASPISSALGYLLLVGAGGSILFTMNMLFKRLTLWPLRLALIVVGYSIFFGHYLWFVQ